MKNHQDLIESIRRALAAEESPLTPDRIFELVPEADSLADLGKALRRMVNDGEAEQIDTGRKGHRAHPIYAYQLLTLVKPAVTVTETDKECLPMAGGWEQLSVASADSADSHKKDVSPNSPAARADNPTAASPVTPANAAGRNEAATERPAHALGADEETKELGCDYYANGDYLRAQELEGKVADQQTTINFLKNELEGARARNADLQGRLNEANAEIREHERAYASLYQEIDRLKDELQQARASLDRANVKLIETEQSRGGYKRMAEYNLAEIERQRKALAAVQPPAANTPDALALHKSSGTSGGYNLDVLFVLVDAYQLPYPLARAIELAIDGHVNSNHDLTLAAATLLKQLAH